MANGSTRLSEQAGSDVPCICVLTSLYDLYEHLLSTNSILHADLIAKYTFLDPSVKTYGESQEMSAEL